MEEGDIRSAVERLARCRTFGEVEKAWEPLRELGETVVPYLEEAYPSAPRACARVAMVFYSVRYARIEEGAFRLGIRALNDRATLVRYRACGLLAYSLRRDALPSLRKALEHPDPKTTEDAAAAIRAIEARNHHLFRDRDGSGHVRWIVNPEDDSLKFLVRQSGWLQRLRQFVQR